MVIENERLTTCLNKLADTEKILKEHSEFIEKLSLSIHASNLLFSTLTKQPQLIITWLESYPNYIKPDNYRIKLEKI